MALKTLSVERERRKSPRLGLQGRVEIDVLPSQIRLEADPVNLSEAGICLRMEETLEISSQVRLRLFLDTLQRPVECGGRIAWVVQRLDLRTVAPFLYDVGIEFINPPSRLQRLGVRAGTPPKAAPTRVVKRAHLESIMVKNRCYTPRLTEEPSPNGRWHLIVTVDGTPCFSHRYATEKNAVAAWQQVKRQPNKLVTPGRRA